MLTDAPEVVVKGTLFTQLSIINDRGQQVVREVTLLQILYLCQHQRANLFERLTRLRHTNQQERRVVLLGLYSCLSHLHLHLLIQVQVKDTCTTIAQQVANHIQRITLQVRSLLGQPTYPHLVSLLTNDGRIRGRCQFTLCREHGLTDISTWFPLSEIAINDSHHLVRIEVTSHTDSHIIGHIPLLKVVLDIRNGWILQVCLRTDSGLSTIGVCRRQLLTHRTPYLVTIIGQIHVILLIDSLQLRMETANHHVLETVSLYLCPVLHLVRRDVLGIAGDIVRRESIGTLCTDGSHQLVVLVGNEVLGSHLRNRVYLVVGLLTSLRVSQLAVGLVALFYLVKERSLSYCIIGSKLLRAFKHQVLQIVRQTRCFCRVVL